MSSRTEATAANVEQSAASIEQISATVKNTADNVQQAARLAANNSEAAARGGVVIADVVRTMEDINNSSKKIGDIIGVIDGIAFQTNILALNAGGRGGQVRRAGAGLRRGRDGSSEPWRNAVPRPPAKSSR